MPLSWPPLYSILDPEQTQGRSPEVVLRELLAAGVAMLQLRVKNLAASDFFELARLARAETRSRGCKLIVNDRVDIALACDADGVHLGQEDLPLGVGRKLMIGKIVGISTHDIDQAREAEKNGADYIGFGPVFETATKATGYSARGVDMLREIRAAVKIPIVAIGGITEQNVQQVWRAGADSAAIISDILSAGDIAAKTRRILSAAPVR
ncbi:MAG TPA: thiamine phosphate synthase [Methylomirabilota bacterium]|nr:thiamine phosphate synthase [Methylomirabilota bacterium]